MSDTNTPPGFAGPPARSLRWLFLAFLCSAAVAIYLGLVIYGRVTSSPVHGCAAEINTWATATDERERSEREHIERVWAAEAAMRECVERQ